MGWAKKLPSGMWKGAYRYGVKVLYVPGTYPSKAEAKRQADAKEVESRKIPAPAPLAAPAKTRFADFEPEWQALRTVSEGTKRRKACYLNLHVMPYWRDWWIEDIKRSDVQRWVNQLGEPVVEELPGGKLRTVRDLAPASVYQCLSMLSGYLEAAVVKEVIGANPCRGVARPRPTPAPNRYLERFEFDGIQRFHKLAQDGFLCDFLHETGMRLGEAYGFHIESYNPHLMIVEVERNWDSEALVMKTPKDHQRRAVPVSRRLAARIDAHIAERGLGKPPQVRYEKGLRKPTTGLLFTEDGRGPVDDHRFENRFQAACAHARRAGVLIGHVRRHDLRHTCASRLLRKGVPLSVVQEILGHASSKTTEIYKHLGNSYWEEVRQVLDEYDAA
ncbi:integrase family protein [Segniliparus rotundus DSM 44985]|uniref:Integrase family protein n=1 Tax=Segniliparus rotundus (strain ATCC BAA-972 / CDC 1076 / CIP 108378 / DSM 44985 / JCM 13578) TaxID=640132 RepID=D6ZAQ2_SEGRD|nr:site-specific integrase [Segniliparus rotundus]ADG98788.1 integrase family protein [Segniliparus rotundus DSM 44985]